MSHALARSVVDAVLNRLQHGTLTIVDTDGTRHRYGAGEPQALMQLRSQQVWRSFLGGSSGLAEAYAEGLWDSPDLVALARLGAAAMPALDRVRRFTSPAVRPIELGRSLLRPAGRHQRRRDIAAHYDLGNELFSRMLDPTMTYSSAYYIDPGMTLEEAQLAKLELVCEKLELEQSDRVLEIGTGWGSFAVHAAATRGCHVTTTTISREQYHHAWQRVKAAGLSDRVTVLDRDFLDIDGSYDKLVSIEMIEAVGWRRFASFLAHCSGLLAADGAMLLQAITIDDRAYHVEKATRSFVKDVIFPGGALPSLPVLREALARRTDLTILDLEDLTDDYVLTLRCWRDLFAAKHDELMTLGYDERFSRLWELYLAYCEGGFSARRISDFQLLLGKPLFRSTCSRDGALEALADEHVWGAEV